MEKSRLAKIVGVGLLGIFCLPVIAQAQGGLVKAGYNTVKAACKEAGCPLIKMIEESSGKINKAVVESAKASKVGVEMINPGVTGIAKKATVNTPKRLIEQPGFLHQVEQHVQEGMSGFRQPQAPKVKAPTTYYSTASNTERGLNFPGEMSQKIATFDAKMGRYYQNKLEWELWNSFFKETATKEISFFDSFPKTLAEQQAFLDKFLDNQTEEVKLLFSSALDTTTKAQIAWVAGDGEKAYKKASVEEIKKLFYRAITKVREYQCLLAESYAVDPLAEAYLVDVVAYDYHLSLTQVEDLIRAVDLRTEKIANLSGSELESLLRQEAQNITRAAQLSQVRAAKALNFWEGGSRWTRNEIFSFHQISVLREVIARAHLDLIQSEQLFTYAANAITRWDPDGSRIDYLLKFMEDNALRGNAPSAAEVMEEARSIFKAW